MNQEVLREGNNIGKLMMMNWFGKAPAEFRFPFPPTSKPLPVLLMQNKTEKKNTEKAKNSPRKVWNNETKSEDVRMMHSPKEEGIAQVDFKAKRDLQTARENISSRWHKDLGWKCWRAAMSFLALEDLKDLCRGGAAGWGCENPVQFSGVLEKSCYFQKQDFGRTR